MQLEKSSRLKELVHTCSKEELIWINGYINGLLYETPTSVSKVSILYGTETGNSKSLALNFSTEAKKKGLRVKLIGLDQYKLQDLYKETHAFIIISTHGEGDPPDAAKAFMNFLGQDNLSLPQLQYSVLALGDTAYPLFCKAGEDVDALLEKAGAKRMSATVKCDVDYEQSANDWFTKIMDSMQPATQAEAATTPVVASAKSHERKYYNGIIHTNINLNDIGSTKKTFHIEIGTEETVDYLCGDSLALKPVNEYSIVQKIIELTGADANKTISLPKATGSIKDLLSNNLNILYLSNSTIKKYAAIVQKDIPPTRVDLLDLLQQFPVNNSTQFEEILGILLPMAPRLYSIASSPAAHEQEIHLTVALDTFETETGEQTGNCSRYLGELAVKKSIQFYIHKNNAFKLPPANAAMIMIGPGTGIAPFRAFLAERDYTGASGKNWLFMGERNFSSDFLYQTEIQQYQKTNMLHKISLAFSRDQSAKIYVQHRMLEQAVELFKWIEQGAYLYIAGAKHTMSVDVEQVLLQIIQEQSKITNEEAILYLQKMKQEKRYQKDVY
ncbi:MAG: sulfite reductase [Sphingobacteriia bacterium]|nr:MAG: sulfite reductase [Sphingobacteriia bacterium]